MESYFYKLTESERANFISVQSSITWDEYFMLQAMFASFKSKDPSTKVGCVFVDAERHQVSMGYNGAIAGIDENKMPWGRDRSVSLEFQKYGYVIHAEANAISHAKSSLKNTVGYVTLFPCNECAKLIATQKVSEIIYLSDKYKDSPEVRTAKRIFDLAQVRYRPISISKELISQAFEYLNNLACDV